MLVQNFIKLSAAIHELSCPQTFLPYLNLAMVKSPKIRSCDLDLWPTTLKFTSSRAVAKIHVRAKFHRARCSDSWVILHTEKITHENNTARRYRADSNKIVPVHAERLGAVGYCIERNSEQLERVVKADICRRTGDSVISISQPLSADLTIAVHTSTLPPQSRRLIQQQQDIACELQGRWNNKKLQQNLRGSECFWNPNTRWSARQSIGPLPRAYAALNDARADVRLAISWN